MAGISPSDVTVVVAGPVGGTTAAVLESVHAHLPGSQVVLSTWRGTAPDALRALARVVESEDPGTAPGSTDPDGAAQPPTNTNRMVTSAAAGLRAVERPFALKLRTDTPLVSDAVLRWRSLAARGSGSGVFRERLLTCSVATRPNHADSLLFHPSDCVHFGLAEDVAALWSLPPVDEQRNTGYWRRQGRPSPWAYDARFANEQLLWLGCLSAHGITVDHPHAGAPATAEVVERSRRLLVENFVVLEPWQLGVRFAKLAPLVRASPVDSYLGFDAWLADGGAAAPA